MAHLVYQSKYIISFNYHSKISQRVNAFFALFQGFNVAVIVNGLTLFKKHISGAYKIKKPILLPGEMLSKVRIIMWL